MSTIKPWYMTAQRRKQMKNEFQHMLKQNHDGLLASCNVRYPETIEGVLAENPKARDPQRIVEMNKRLNENSRSIEDLIMSIDARWQD